MLFFCHISTFKIFEAKRAKKAQKIKNHFSKCVLDLNFAPIKGYVFFIVKKSKIRCTLLYISFLSLNSSLMVPPNSFPLSLFSDGSPEQFSSLNKLFSNGSPEQFPPFPKLFSDDYPEQFSSLSKLFSDGSPNS